ncbi:MAG: sodium:calcium exchanger [Rhodospirillaceae bacterium]|nr:sodium:calcium exchanger [Rhodospirillaceae bacterium]
MMATLTTLTGLLLLIIGAEIMIRGAVAVARNAEISPHVIGLTVIAFGTSAPELFVSLKAAHLGSPGIAIGNVIGSNIANILLMIGTVGIIYPFVCTGRSLRRDCLVLVISTVVFIMLAGNGIIERWHGAIMVTCLTTYLFYCYFDERRFGIHIGIRAQEADEIDHVPTTNSKAWLYTVAGLIGVLCGARLLVSGAMDIAEALGVSETVIGITMVALGTSMPELATTVVGAIRRQNDVALGNIIGSNIFNTLGILGAVSFVQPLEIPHEVLSFDLWIMTAVTAFFVVAVISLQSLVRPIAISFSLIYVAYIYAQFFPDRLGLPWL